MPKPTNSDQSHNLCKFIQHTFNECVVLLMMHTFMMVSVSLNKVINSYENADGCRTNDFRFLGQGAHSVLEQAAEEAGAVGGSLPRQMSPDVSAL